MTFVKGHPNYNIRHTEETKQKMRGHRVFHILKNCFECNKEITVPPHLKTRKKFCSRSCLGKFLLPKVWIGRKHTEESKYKMKFRNIPKGKNHYKWIEDRKLKKYQDSEEKRSPMYKMWRKSVCDRDKWVCRIADVNCDGRLEVHHILSWRDYPELRYDINNGITLCHAHHPRKRDNEAKLSPYFQSLVAEMK